LLEKSYSVPATPSFGPVGLAGMSGGVLVVGVLAIVSST